MDYGWEAMIDELASYEQAAQFGKFINVMFEEQAQGKKLVLLACESSGTIRNAINGLNGDWSAFSCDLLPADDGSSRHFQGDVTKVLDVMAEELHAMIAHPPCTYLAVSGIHWNKRRPERAAQTEKALEFVQYLMDQPIASIAIENPVSVISSRIRKPDQIVQPWMFGDDASKKTCLWLKGFEKLKPTEILIKDRYANQTASGQNKLGPSKDRWKERSRTYQGIANAIANQWFFNV